MKRPGKARKARTNAPRRADDDAAAVRAAASDDAPGPSIGQPCGMCAKQLEPQVGATICVARAVRGLERVRPPLWPRAGRARLRLRQRGTTATQSPHREAKVGVIQPDHVVEERQTGVTHTARNSCISLLAGVGVKAFFCCTQVQPAQV